MSPQRVDATSMVPALQRALHPEILDDVIRAVELGDRACCGDCCGALSGLALHLREGDLELALSLVVVVVAGYAYRGHEHKAK